VRRFDTCAKRGEQLRLREQDAFFAGVGIVSSAVPLQRKGAGPNTESVEALPNGVEQPVSVRPVGVENSLASAELVAVVIAADRSGCPFQPVF